MSTITDTLKAQVQDAIDRHALKDDAQWDLGMVVLPQQPPAHFLTMLIPAAIQLGEWHQAGAIIEQAHKVSAEDIDGLVNGMFETLREERTKSLTEGTAKVAKQEAPPKGLIVP